jgi:hypothetical protein
MTRMGFSGALVCALVAWGGAQANSLSLHTLPRSDRGLLSRVSPLDPSRMAALSLHSLLWRVSLSDSSRIATHHASRTAFVTHSGTEASTASCGGIVIPASGEQVPETPEVSISEDGAGLEITTAAGDLVVVTRIETVARTRLAQGRQKSDGAFEFASADGRVKATFQVREPTANRLELRYAGEHFIRVSIALGGPAEEAPRPCRLDPGDKPHVVQMALGHAASGLNDSVYDYMRDLAMSSRGSAVVRAAYEGGRARLTATFHSSRKLLYLDLHRGFMKVERGVAYYRPRSWSIFQQPVSGWCPWYYYYLDTTEEEMLKNARWLAEELKPYGCRWVQLDDAYQDYPNEHGRDWDTLDPAKFPHSLAHFCAEVKKLGLSPGLWLIPQTRSSDEFAAAHPDWIVKDENGEYFNAGWSGRYLLDVSREDVLAYIRDLFEGFDEAGFEYYKIDGQPPVAAYYRQHRERLSNPGATGDEAYRRSLEVIRETIGPDRFLLGCYGIPLESIGYVDACRTGLDVWADWEGFRPAIKCTMRWYFLHDSAWICDPDCLLVREPLTLDQARAWATLYAVTGQHLMLSDKMYDLPKERVDVVKAVFPAQQIRPMDLYPYEGRPRIWDLKVDGPDGQYDVVAVFNWDRDPYAAVLRWADLGLADDAYLVHDFWEDRPLGMVRHGLAFTLAPTSCRVLVVREPAGRPQVAGCSRHVVGDRASLEGVTWDAAGRTLSGSARIAKSGDPISLVIWNDGLAPVGSAAPGLFTRLSLDGKTGETVRWAVTYAAAVRGAEATPVAGLTGASGPTAVTLVWRGPSLAYVVRDGVLIGAVEGGTFADTDLAPETEYAYQVFPASPLDGSLGLRAASLRVQTKQLGDTWLDQMIPASYEQSWASPRRGLNALGKPLVIAGQEFARGVGTHARSEVVYNLHRGFRRFTASIGVDYETKGKGSVRFQVFGDGRLLFESAVMRGDEQAKQIEVDVYGVQELKLVVLDGGDGSEGDYGDWCDAELWVQ